MIDNSKARDTDTNTNPPAGRLFPAARPVRRIAAFGGVPAALLAADSASSASPGDILGHVLGGLGSAVEGAFAAQPLVATGVTVVAVGAGYMKVRKDMGGSFNGEDDGFATKRQIRLRMSRRAMLKARKTQRPSLTDVPARQIPTTEIGVVLGYDRKTGKQVVCPIEDSTLTIAPMGGGKTGLIANFLLDAPGSAVVTSTKPDIMSLTEELRAQRGGETLLFNPQGLGGRVSTLLHDPVMGCKDPVVAIRRARYLLEGSDATGGLENRNFWESASFKVLKSFLWAADMAGLSLLDVARWSKKPFETPASAIFEQYADVAPIGWAEDLQQTQASGQQGSTAKSTTLDNVFQTLSMTFMCLSLPTIAQSILDAHRPDRRQFDAEKFVASGKDTAYLLGENEGTGGIGPLYAALVGDIYDAARRRASFQQGGRNDPPAGFILDEAALICPVPLDEWTADARGLGIVVHAAVQSRGQLRKRWGTHGADIIWDNCVALILGGLKNDDHLESLSRLTGKSRLREETVSSSTAGGSTHTSTSTRWVKEATMSPSDIKDLDPGQVLVIRKHIKALVVNYQMAWDRKDIKGLARSRKKQDKARQRKLATAGQTANDWGTAPVQPPAPAMAPTAAPEPWAPVAPAASGTTAGDIPRPRLAAVSGEAVAEPPAAPAPLPGPPVHPPTIHLEKDAAAVAEQGGATEPTPLRKRVAGGVDDDLGAF